MFWPPASVNSLQEGLRRVRHRKYALIVDSPLAEYLITQLPCDLYTTEPFLERQQYAFVVSKNSSLKHKLNIQIHSMEQNSEMQEMYLKWWTDECRNLSPELNQCAAQLLNNTNSPKSDYRNHDNDGNMHGNGRYHRNGRNHGDNKVVHRNKHRSKDHEEDDSVYTSPVISSAHTTSHSTPWHFSTAAYVGLSYFSLLIISNHAVTTMSVCITCIIRWLFT